MDHLCIKFKKRRELLNIQLLYMTHDFYFITTCIRELPLTKMASNSTNINKANNMLEKNI
jgi:hypothetical protein